MNHEYKIVDVQNLYAAEHFSVLRSIADFSRHTPSLMSVSTVDLLIRPQAFIAKKAGALVGFVSINRPEVREGLTWSQVSTLAVLPGHENNGIGTALVHNATRYIHKLGMHAYALVEQEREQEQETTVLPSFLKNGYELSDFGNYTVVVNCREPKITTHTNIDAY